MVRHVLDDKLLSNTEDMKLYMEDVMDRICQTLEHAQQLRGLCESLIKECGHFQDRQQSRTIYFLTILSTFYFPWQFLTGFYGMNFEDTVGRPHIPLLGVLSTENGFYQFWALSTFLTVVLYFFYRYMSLL